MPGGDGTGPIGRGPMTGRAAGLCAGYPTPGYGRGSGLGLGRRYMGRGRGFWWKSSTPDFHYTTAPSREEEKTYLENMIKNLEEEIKSMRGRLKEKSKDKKESS
jgi:hypothetical protein